MSVLSNVDLEKEIITGNIRIYPLDHSSIKGSTFNLKASEYAWSLKTRKKIVSGNKIKIPPNDTGIIATKEVIWVSKKIGGSYHSKVSIVSKGGGHIGTTLDPEWIGHSIIALHNHSDKEIEIGVNDTFVSIMFSYLNKATNIEQDNNSSQIEVLSQLFDLTDNDKRYFDEPWKKQSKELLIKVKTDKEYISLNAKNHNPYKSKVIFYAIFAIVLVGSLYLQTVLDKNNFFYTISTWTTGVGLSGLLVPLILSIYTNLK